jgi:hypothetical protein
MLGVRLVLSLVGLFTNLSVGVGVAWESTSREKVVGYLSIVVVLFCAGIHNTHFELAILISISLFRKSPCLLSTSSVYVRLHLNRCSHSSPWFGPLHIIAMVFRSTLSISSNFANKNLRQ